jgi:ATP-binding cassette subfamily F protein uup
MPVIDSTNLTKSFSDRTILRDVTLTIRTGEKVGLVGDNGSGKSTLGRVLAGEIELDGGEIALRRGASIGYLAQEPELPAGQSISEVVLSSLKEWNAAKRRYDELTATLADASDDFERLAAEQAAAGETVERLGGWERLHEAETVIGHLGILDSSRDVGQLSGGEQRRVALAHLLVRSPDLAILDEPTNHLDVEAIEWLEDHLQNTFRGAVLLITHDRYVLDRVTTRTLELADGEVTSYDGGYAVYLEARAERRAHAERTERNRQNFLRRELEWLRRQPKARGTKQKARTSRAHQAMGQSAPKQEQQADLRLGSQRLGHTILELASLQLDRDGRRLVDGFDLALAKGERIGVVGPNGCGKTSLLLALQGELEPTGGRIELGANTRIGYLDQTRGDLDPEKTIREEVAGELSHIDLAGERLTVDAYLERFLFDRKSTRLKVGVLSGGEQARVCLAKLLCKPVNLLLLDEPTNDLDVSTLAALEEMLIGYAGSAIIVSHDRWFLDRVATSILAFEEGGELDLHRGGYSEFRERRAEEERRRASGKASDARKATSKATASERRDRPRKLSYAETRELEGMVERIEAAEEALGGIEATLADPDTYGRGGEGIAELQRKLDAARAEVDGLTARWEELEARKEALTT